MPKPIRHATGRYVTISTAGGETVRAFVPHSLPPAPPVTISPELRDKLDQAHVAIGRLDTVTTLLPDAHLFLYSYVRKEAVLSSQIEGTQSSLSDLLLFEADAMPGVPLDDVREASRYVSAMDHGLARLRTGFPLSNRLVREIHGILLSHGRGAASQPGEFRRSQNWIGGSRPGNAAYVPPPPDLVPECMGALERFLHDDPVRTPTLLKAALAHVQFETVHPFLDGNGRVGRLLITFLMCAEGLLSEPLLYLSLYFKQHRDRYYELLDQVRAAGAWEDWLAFFADGVIATATGAVSTAQQLVTLAQADRTRIERSLGRLAGSAIRVHQAMQERPVTFGRALAERTGLSVPSVHKTLHALEERGLVREVTGRRRNRVYSYSAYLGLLAEGT
jgi:Fic family protein